MRNKTTTYKWAYLPFVFSSAAILATQATAAPAGSQQYQDAKQVNRAGHQYVGGKTQVGFGITDDGDVDVELDQVISESDNHSTGVGLWAGYDVMGDDTGMLGRGGQLNHNWVARDKSGRATHVNKVFAAYDRNDAGHDKATVGYGRENQDLFWEGHVSKGLSGRKNIREINGQKVSDRAYDYGVGGSVGTFIEDSNVRVRAGLDHEWSDKVGVGEKDARNTTLSGGIEKFFQGTGHSLSLDVAGSKRNGGYDVGDDTDVTGRLGYRYDFGGASIYQPDQRYRRVRVEVPGKSIPAYKTVPVYAKKTIRTPYKQLVKSTMELEGQTFFKLNSAKLIPSAKTRLKQIAAQIRKSGYKGAIRITGNTCGLGDPVYDQRLSEQRANAVRNYLIKKGFNPDHLMARGLGKGKPKYPRTPDQDFKNRRVDIEYVSERQQYKTGYKTEQKTVQTGTRRVPLAGAPGAPRVIWKTEAIPTSPAWIKRALHNNIKHDRNVNTFTTTEGFDQPVNSGPNAVDDTANTACTAPVTINVIGNDTDPENDTLTITSFTQPAHGTVTEGANGQLIYTPDGTACGEDDTFTYTISDGNGGTDTATVVVSVDPKENTAPVAVDDSATTGEGESVTLDSLSNDSDPDGDTLTITSVGTPSNGTAVIVNNQIVYTPNPGFTGVDTFTYTISDGNGGTATATETVTVTAEPNKVPDAVDDTASTVCSGPVTIDVLGNDTDPDGDTLTVTSFTQPANGTVTRGANGQLIYTSDGTACGEDDTFTYTISDGNGGTDTATVTVSVDPKENTAPVAEDDSETTKEGVPVTLDSLANDSDPDGDTLTITSVGTPSNGTAVISGGQIIYTPNLGFVGTDTFTYTISDGNGGTATATETVVVTAEPNKAPIAVDDTERVACSGDVVINVLANDSDPDGDTLTITSFTQPSNGTVTEGANGQLIYTSDGTACGVDDTFTYTISDGNGGTATATVTVSTDPKKNTAPVAEDDKAVTEEDTPVTLDTLANDSDPDGDTLTITSVEDPDNGTAVISGGQIIYTPNPGFTGTDTFTYTISDGNGGTATATETVVVKPKPNLPPIATDDKASTGCNAITINVLDNDSDPDGDALSIIGVGTASLGTAVISGNTIVYTPSKTCGKGNIGLDTFSYTISDGNGNNASANVTVDVKGAKGGNTNAEPDDVMTDEGVPVTINVLANDAGTGLKIIAVDNPKNGTAVIVGDTVVYTPDAGFTGMDSFWYDIVDANGYNDSALIVVDVVKGCAKGYKCN